MTHPINLSPELTLSPLMLDLFLGKKSWQDASIPWASFTSFKNCSGWCEMNSKLLCSMSLENIGVSQGECKKNDEFLENTTGDEKTIIGMSL